MKSKLKIPAAILLLFVALAASSQPASPWAAAIDPTTGLPVSVRGGMGGGVPGLPAPPVSPWQIDPATGRPLATAEPQWIDPNWPDPNIVLTNLTYDGLPLSEVARELRERFKNNFDILPMPRTFGKDWGIEISIQLQLKDVKASDVFNAMNLVFENDRTPVRWELKMNGNRPIALLRVLPEAAPQPEPPQSRPAETRRMVFFIGNLLGDEKSGGMTMNQIVKTFDEIWPADLGKPLSKPEGVIQFHEAAQLIVVNGTRDQLDLVQQTLTALRQKVELDRSKRMSADTNSPMGRLLNQRIQELKSTGGGSQ